MVCVHLARLLCFKPLAMTRPKKNSDESSQLTLTDLTLPIASTTSLQKLLADIKLLNSLLRHQRKQSVAEVRHQSKLLKWRKAAVILNRLFLYTTMAYALCIYFWFLLTIGVIRNKPTQTIATEWELFISTWKCSTITCSFLLDKKIFFFRHYINVSKLMNKYWLANFKLLYHYCFRSSLVDLKTQQIWSHLIPVLNLYINT